ncbi:DNA-3-methyladenine glycosylase [Bombilactobacillus bombi]|uniref:DNA-3-methyladenine glycosylase n=1 Tax=Bombilactobacillus bombi TaxID=1303590 RepID=UPI002811C23D|nr:DNA-3-methyladenine glycosylase [Bombilactobacillus bombi]
MIDNNFFAAATTDVITQHLLGHELLYQSSKGPVGGLIVEAEAYMGVKDSAAHSFGGRRTSANEALYAAAGTIYIYSIYGHYMLDIATQELDEPQGILIRALQPTRGLLIMQKNRPQGDFNLTNGPGKLMAALGINSLDLNLQPLTASPLSISSKRIQQPRKIIASPRINVSVGSWQMRPLRFYVAHNPYVSGMKKGEYDLDKYGWR